MNKQTKIKVARKVKYKAKKSELVWAYLIKHPLATPAEVAKATGVSYALAYACKKKVGTPKEVFEKEAVAPRAAVNDDTSRLQTLGDRIRKWWKAA